jgi:hypothetical protein
MAQDQNQVQPNYGPQPKGKANIVMMGQTMTEAWGADPYAMGTIPEVKEYPDL